MKALQNNIYHIGSALVLAGFFAVQNANAAPVFDPAAFAAGLEKEVTRELNQFESDMRKETEAAVGMAFAVAALPQAQYGHMISTGASYKSFAVGYSYGTRNHVFKAHAAANAFGEYLGAVGYGYKF